jgi:hypothetical protein
MIVIPMAGESRRFREAGYGLPKHRLMLRGESLFDHAVGSFRAYFDTQPFLFVVRDDGETPAFVEARGRAMGVRDARVVVLDGPTGGQAETVERGLDRAGVSDEGHLTIFNIDTFRPGFIYPDAPWFPASDGYLEVFRSRDPGFSFALPLQNAAPLGQVEPRVAETAEKRPISDLASTGLYHFRRTEDFRLALADERAAPSAPELYVAPLYNALIRRGRNIHFQLIEESDVIFCGTPMQYEHLLAQKPSDG